MVFLIFRKKTQKKTRPRLMHGATDFSQFVYQAPRQHLPAMLAMPNSLSDNSSLSSEAFPLTRSAAASMQTLQGFGAQPQWCAPQQQAKPKRRRGAAALDVVPKTNRSRARTKQTTAVHKETIEHQQSSLQMVSAEQKRMNQTEQRVIQFGPTGLPLTETTITRTTADFDKKDSWKACWQSVKKEREDMFHTMETWTQEDCKNKSSAFRYIERRICKEVALFRKKVKCLLDGQTEKAWTDFDFISRFLFGLENTWEQDAQLLPGEVPWLACLWTMQEMLDLCNDKNFVQFYCAHPFHVPFYCAQDDTIDITTFPERLFCINSQMMCGFVTGQLLVHVLPQLAAVMRHNARQETDQDHFPCFSEYILHDQDVPTLLLEYDFSNVEDSIPAEKARGCQSAGTCCVFGAEDDNNVNVQHQYFCDAALVQLLGRPEIKRLTMQSAKAAAFKEPSKKRDEDYD